MIGHGRSFLKRKVNRCISAGGVPQIRTSFAGDEYRSKVIFACWGKGNQVEGGTIKGLSPGLVKKIRSAESGYNIFTSESEEEKVGRQFVREWEDREPGEHRRTRRY